MTKRIISVLLALVLVLALAMPAMAAQVTIEDTVDNRTYAIYQIFTGDKASDDKGIYLTEAEFGANINEVEFLKALELPETATATEAVEALTAKFGTNGKEAAKFIKLYVDGTPTEVTTANGAGAVAELAHGYYFVEETSTGEGVNTVSALILEVTNDTTIKTKRSDVPVTNKTMYPSEPVNVSENYIGEEIPFEVSVTIPENYDKYDYYELTLKDTMHKGLSYKEGSAVVTGSSNEVEVVPDGDNTIITLKTGNLVNVAGLAGTTIKINYTAILNDDAVIGNEGNINEFTVGYDTTPDIDDTKWTTPKYTVVFTFKIDGYKFDGDKTENAQLPGAKFVLRDGTTDTAKYLAYNDDGEVTWVDDQKDAYVMTSGDDGKFEAKGLDVGTYYLQEIEAPMGYNKVNELQPVTITKPEYNTAVSPIVIKAEDGLADGAVEVEVENNKGTTLPETGGIGTTIFYLVGGLMMAAAVVLLVAKKRTVNE